MKEEKRRMEGRKKENTSEEKMKMREGKRRNDERISYWKL